MRNENFTFSQICRNKLKKKMLEYKLVLSAYKMTYFLRSLGQMVYHTCCDFKFDLRSSLYHPLLSAHWFKLAFIGLAFMCYLISQTESLEVVSHVLAICNISYIVDPIQYERDDVCNQNTTYIGSISMDRIRLSQAERPKL